MCILYPIKYYIEVLHGLVRSCLPECDVIRGADSYSCCVVVSMEGG
jgi:hypothetical protein